MTSAPFRFGMLIAGSLLLGACATMQPVSPPQSVEREELSSALVTMQDWGLIGRIAVKHDDGGGQGKLRWQQEAATARISLSGPLGIGASEILWEPRQVTFRQGNEEASELYTGANAAEQFLESRLGWNLPVSSIRFWVRGIPDPDFAFEEDYDETGGLTQIRQRGWQISYKQYVNVSGWLLPSKLDVLNDSVRLRLIADEWLVPPRAVRSGPE